MRKGLFLNCLLVCLVLAGCQGEGRGTLDDKKLTMEDHIKGAYPRYYEPVSKKEAEKALPFPVQNPQTLPFKMVRTTYQISDWGEKRNIMLNTIFYPRQNGENVYLLYRVTNFLPSDEKSGEGKQVKLENGTKAYFAGNNDLPILTWEEDGLFHRMEYLIRSGEDVKKAKDQMIQSASSIYE